MMMMIMMMMMMMMMMMLFLLLLLLLLLSGGGEGATPWLAGHLNGSLTKGHHVTRKHGYGKPMQSQYICFTFSPRAGDATISKKSHRHRKQKIAGVAVALHTLFLGLKPNS